MVILPFLLTPFSGNPQSFVRVFSGTKANILKIMMINDHEGFFLTDKIYSLNGDVWEKMDFPVTRKIVTFFAFSKNDIWFSVNLEINTSLLYHYHDGVTEPILLPFPNHITAFYFPSPDLGFFTGYSDVAVYEKGRFGIIKPTPIRSITVKIFGTESERFWLLTLAKELYFYERGNYQRILTRKMVKDVHFLSPDHCFILCDDEILEFRDYQIKQIYESAELKKAMKIRISGTGEIWLTGVGGLILVYKDKKMRKIIYPGNDELSDVSFSDNTDIWISGSNGTLLYSGKHQFPDYTGSYPGFSAHKIISYGIDIDNEYGVGLADLNGDDKTDIYAVCIYHPNRLYINHLDPKTDKSPESCFTEEGIKRGASGVMKSEGSLGIPELKIGVAIADVDNDGDQDIYLSYLNKKNKLLLNDGKGYFRDVSNQDYRACEDLKRSNSAAFSDIDLDGDLDLFVTSENSSNKLYLNDGTGHFTDITESAGLSSSGGGMCCSFADINNDGYPDLCISFWYPSNKLYLNETKNGKVKFRDITDKTDLRKSEPTKSNAVVFADVNNDGNMDLFIANRYAANKLYLNNGTGYLKDVSKEVFDDKVFLSNGAVFADFDLDGYQDLYVTNVGENVLYKNMGGKYFKDVTTGYGADLSGYCTGCASGDMDHDGDIDLYVSNFIKGSSTLFINRLEKRNSVTFRLQGTRSNRDAIGAKIFLYIAKPKGDGDSLAGYMEISGGGGYGSVSAREAIFGILPGLNYHAIIIFPSSGNIVKIEKIKSGEVYRVFEENGLRAIRTNFQKSATRFVTDRETRPEIIKYLIVFVIFAIYLRTHRKGSTNIIMIRRLMCLSVIIVFFLVNQILLFSSSFIIFFISPAVAMIGLIILHLITERILLKRLAEKEKTDLREKISRDLHDDLASTLGSISIYSNTLKRLDGPSHINFPKLSLKISELTQTALQSITDIIWMTAPRNDSLQSLISKTGNLMFDILTDNQISFKAEIDIPERKIILQDKLKNNVFLIFKEALHNIIRHSGAKNVTFQAGLEEKVCTVRLTDDGHGFPETKDHNDGSYGNGLINMQRRATESMMDLKIRSFSGKGTEIQLSFKI